jgi:hypothetical protein
MRRLFLTIVLILASVTAVSVALAQSGPLEISWYTIDEGGTTASYGGDFSTSATMGQVDAGTSSGGIYAVQGGFWGVRSAVPPAPGDYQVYLPLIRR